MIYTKFYSELGKLLYAIADLDGWITQKEKQKLQAIVEKELVPAEKHKDEYGVNVDYYSEIEFDILDDQIADADSAYESFIGFVEKHHTAFDERMKKICVHLAKELASIHRKTNKNEKQLIQKLRKALEKIEMKKGKSLPGEFVI